MWVLLPCSYESNELHGHLRLVSGEQSGLGDRRPRGPVGSWTVGPPAAARQDDP